MAKTKAGGTGTGTAFGRTKARMQDAVGQSGVLHLGIWIPAMEGSCPYEFSNEEHGSSTVENGTAGYKWV